MTVAMAGSATAAYGMIRRWTRWKPAAFVGGLIYGFSPYMVGHGTSHPNLAFVPIPPLIVLVVDEILIRQRGSPTAWGTVLGFLAAAQFFISSEILATSFVMATIAVAFLILTNTGMIRANLGYALRALLVGAAVLLCVAAYPIWMALAGPGHINGAIQPDAQSFRADLLGVVVPTVRQAISPPSLRRIGDHLGGSTIENGSYLGAPLLVLLLAGVFVLRRSLLVRLCAVLAAAAFVLSLGARLLVEAQPTTTLKGLPLPGEILHKMPILADVIPVRYSLYVTLFASLIVGLFLDHLHGTWPDNRLRRTIPIALSIACLIPLIPAWPYATQSIAVPAYFTSGAVDTIPAGSVALLYPFPNDEHPQAMAWQATAQMRFRMPGGYFRVPVPGTRAQTYHGIPSVSGDTLDELYRGSEPVRSAVLRQDILAQLRSWEVRSVVAAPQGKDPIAAIDFLTWLFGRQPTSSGGVFVWYGVT